MKFLYWIYHWGWALLAAAWFGWPSRKIKVIGITGTKGKTTSAHLIYYLLKTSGKRVALLSSVTIADGKEEKKNLTGNTMPGRWFIQGWLDKARRNGAEVAVMEVTSQGVTQSRHRFIKFFMAAFTGIHPEHIEAHGSFENYLKAKVAFFEYAAKGNKKSVFFINKDDKEKDLFQKATKERKVVFFNKDDEYSFPLQAEKLKGEMNVYNLALTAAVGREIGLENKKIKEALETFPGVPGRMEFVQNKPFTVVIDYAYTPESLKMAYKTFREMLVDKNKNKIISVFGSAGGGRDKWKRPVLGELAEKYCGEIILTTEEPYNENPNDIISDIEKGIDDKSKVHRITDRREAIKRAMELAEKGDVVALLGKGPEPYINYGKKKVEWNERKVAEEALR